MSILGKYIEEEYNELMKLIEHLREILSSERLVFDIIKEELIEIKNKFGDERRTEISNRYNEAFEKNMDADDENQIEDWDCITM